MPSRITPSVVRTPENKEGKKKGVKNKTKRERKKKRRKIEERKARLSLALTGAQAESRGQGRVLFAGTI